MREVQKKARIKQEPIGDDFDSDTVSKGSLRTIAEILSFYIGISIVTSGMGNSHSRSILLLLAISCLRLL